MWEAIVTTMEAALLRSLGLPLPTIEPVYRSDEWEWDAPIREYRAVIVTETRHVAALGSSPDIATRNLIKMVVRP